LFTGVRKSEFSIATTSQMYDPRQRTWAHDLLKQLYLPPHIMPGVIPSRTGIGPLQDDVVKEIGVEAMPVIAPACHDTGSAVAAGPPARGGQWWVISRGEGAHTGGA